MSFGFSISDIITCYKLADKIYERCFTQAQRADVKYVQFGRDISDLSESLKSLEKVIKNANDQKPPRPWHTDTDHFGAALDPALPEITGDFQRTLKDAHTLLLDHSRFQRNPAGFVDNVRWWSGTERDVNSLRERVRFHVTKVFFILKPFEIQLLLGIKKELEQLRRDVADLRGVVVESINQPRDPGRASLPHTFSIPQELVSRFTAASDVNKPAAFHQADHWPLKEGFDALVFHFSRSTVEFHPLPQLGQKTPEEPRYLNLLKSQWIAQKLKASACFQSTGTDSLWADYMKELEGDIRGQFRRFDDGSLTTPDSGMVSRLPDDCFSIWLIDIASLPPPDLAEQRYLEDKILEFALPRSFGTRYETLTVFRLSDVNLRVVRTTKDEQNPYFHREESKSLSMSETRLIPIYANPSDISSVTNNVILCNGQGQDPMSYELSRLEDVKLFQQALTSYRVSDQMSGFSWCFNGSSVFGDSGTAGILQFWHIKPLPEISGAGDADSLKQSSSIKSPASKESKLNPNARKSAQRTSSIGLSSTTLVSRSSIASPVNGSDGAGTQMLRPEPPVLVIFTICDGKHTFLHIPIDGGVKIDASLCSCNKKKKICTRVVINSSLKPFIVRKVSADHGLYSWDLALFRYPWRRDFHDLKIVEKMKWLDLDFHNTSGKPEIYAGKKYVDKDVKAKENFIKEFILMANLRTTENNNFEKDFQERRRQSLNPGKNNRRQP